MKNNLVATFLSICLCQTTSVVAQNNYVTQDTAYVRSVEKALICLQKGKCTECLENYQSAFALYQRSALSMMRAAVCAYNCNRLRLATDYLDKAVKLDFAVCEDVWKSTYKYPEINPLHTIPLEIFFNEYMNAQKINNGYNPTLQKELTQIITLDTIYRVKLDKVGREFGFTSVQAKPLWESISLLDSLNLLEIEVIIKNYGYPGKSLVGGDLSTTAWLIIQHSPLNIQEKYLPMIKNASDKDELPKSCLALLIDRIRVRKGQKQLYGTQVHNGSNGKPESFEPIEDEVNVNQRRQQMELPKLEDYAKHWGFTYTVPRK